MMGVNGHYDTWTDFCAFSDGLMRSGVIKTSFGQTRTSNGTRFSKEVVSRRGLIFKIDVDLSTSNLEIKITSPNRSTKFHRTYNEISVMRLRRTLSTDPDVVRAIKQELEGI